MPSITLPGPIAVIDVETTGLFLCRHDRVVEVAAVVLDADGRQVREFVSLVNPRRDIGPTSVHGLSARDIAGAPEFGEIAGLLVETLSGSVAVAGHNVWFDLSFMRSEFSRIGYPMPECPTLCTMCLAGGRSLTECCAAYGISFDGETHSALADVRAAGLLRVACPRRSRDSERCN